MNFLDKAVVNIFPSYGMRRVIAKQRLDRLGKLAPITNQRSFDAISGSRTRYDILAPRNSANTAIDTSVESLRNNVRQLEYNNGVVAGPIHRIANHVVSTGFNFQSRVKPDELGMVPKINKKMATEWNTGAEIQFARWSKKADKRLIQTFAELCHSAEMALIRDGGVLVIGRNSNRRGRLIPYCLELLEIDRLKTPIGEIGNLKIRNGIEFDDEGVPKYYYVLKRHPGESYFPAGIRADDYDQIDAFNRNGSRKVLHLYNPLRPEQEIGFSQWAAALKDIQDLDRYTEAEKYAALEDACLTGFIKTKDPQGFQANYTDFDIPTGNNEGTGNRGHEFGVGKMNYLGPDDDIEIHAPKRPNSQFGTMVDQLLRGPANALDVPPQIVSQDWADMNYSNARTVLMMFDISKIVRQAYLINHLCAPVWESVATGFVVHGIVQAPSFDRRKDDYLSHVWIPPGRDYIDPVKEAKGKAIELETMSTTLTDIHASKGKDFMEVAETRARELRKIKDLEKEFGIEMIPKSEPDLDPADDFDTDGKRALRAVK